MAMEITVLLPGLGGKSIQASDWPTLSLPILSRLFSRARCARLTPSTWEQWIAHQFRLPFPLPSAPLSLASQQHVEADTYWLHADPVHLSASGDDVRLIPAQQLSLHWDEAVACTQALNAHFQKEGLYFLALKPDQWFLRVTTEPQLQTTPLPQVCGQLIGDQLPQGPDARRWHACLNEIQMGLHQHAVNSAREQCGRPTINSVWLWGGGYKPTLSRPQEPLQWWSDSLLWQGLASEMQVELEPLPSNATALFRHAGKATVWYDRLQSALQSGDLDQWYSALQSMEADWFQPLWDRVRNGTLRELTCVVEGATVDGVSAFYAYRLTRRDCWALWRKTQPLKSLMTR